MKQVLFRLAAIASLIVLIATQQVAAFTQNDFNCAMQGDNGGTCFYNPNECATTPSTPPAGSGVTINNTAAQKIAQQASTGGTNVGYALYDSTGKLLANYNDTFKNYGASITKSMLLVAYLKQVGSGALSSQAQSELTNMIENSDNASADWVYAHLSNSAADVKAVASSAGMSSFELDTSDSVYILGQSRITANDFARFFSKIDTLFPASQKSFALKLLSNLATADQNGLLKAGLPGTVYSKEGWKPESSGAGAPYIVNQAAQFSDGSTTYGVAVTVGGTSDETSGETIVKNVVSALITSGGANTPSPGSTGSSCSCSGPSTGTPPTTLTGSDNKERIYNYFVAIGLTSIQAAAIYGNFGQESTWNPLDPGGYLAQWSTDRLVGLAALASKEGKPETDLGVQLDYVWQELNANYPDVLKHLKAATTIEDAVNQFMGPNNLAGQPISVIDPSQRSGGYEDPGTPQGQNRVNFANDALRNYGKGGGGGPTGGCTPSGGSTDCTTATGDTKILCEAKRYDGIYYEWAGGHQGISAFTAGCPDPSHPPNNQPHGGPVNGDPGGLSGNPSPCATDCSGLVSIAVSQAFNKDYSWSVSESDGSMQGTGAQNWKSIPISKAAAGDIVTLPGHVEIVDHISGGTVYTFGSHSTGTKTGGVSSPASSWSSGAWHWTGPGS